MLFSTNCLTPSSVRENPRSFLFSLPHHLPLISLSLPPHILAQPHRLPLSCQFSQASMEQGLDAAAATHGHVVEGAETTTDVIQEVAIVGGAGDAARVVAGLVAAAADLEEKAMAGYDSAVPDLDGDKQVVDVVMLLVPLLS
ncbi:hypothetical protein D1007_36202 [Hordeum vulgare]|nr:hypothetical protein D1007_36202 [Hordeum vulgare]